MPASDEWVLSPTGPDGPAVIEVVASTAEGARVVVNVSPPRAFWIGEDPGECDLIVPRGKLGSPLTKLFDVSDGNVVVPPPLHGERSTTPMAARITIADMSFEVRRSEAAGVVCSYTVTSPPLVGRASSGTKNEAVCKLTLPLYTRCPRCGAFLEGEVATESSGTSDEAKWAEHPTREEAIAEAKAWSFRTALSDAQKEAGVVRCPVCRHRQGRSAWALMRSCLLGIALILAVPVALVLGPRHVRVYGSILIVPVLGIATIVHQVTLWLRASAVVLRAVPPPSLPRAPG
jgi:hypothetical protein